MNANTAIDILSMDPNDLYFTPNPELEALDAKLEQKYNDTILDDVNLEWDCEDDVRDYHYYYYDEVDHFNTLHKTFFSYNLFEKLKEYAKNNRISLRDSIYYSQSCHCCGTFFEQEEESGYGNTYCSDVCENAVEVCDRPCYYMHTDNYNSCDEYEVCVICSNPDKVSLFNARYDQSFDEEKIKITQEYVKDNNLYRDESHQQMTIKVAIEYLKCCHNCGNQEIPYGNMYCNRRCSEYIEDYRYPCFRKDDCMICGNNNYYESDDENLIATEDAAILNMIGPVSVRAYEDDEWDEIEAYGEYYYLRKGFYKHVSSVPAPRDGYTSIEIGDQWYIYRI
jgi:hypothetical protein